MVDIDITKLITASSGKIWDEFSEYLDEKALIKQGEEKRELEKLSADSRATKKAVAAKKARVVVYADERAERLGHRSE